MSNVKYEVDANNFLQWLSGAKACTNVVFQALDLTAHDERLAALSQARSATEACVFLGCALGPRMLIEVGTNFSLVFPRLPNRPYDPYRKGLYSPDELFDVFDPGKPETYRNCRDWLTYKGFIKVGADNKPLKPVQYVEVGLDEVLARRLHDFFIEDALEEFLDGRRVVAIMGGHDRLRSEAVFLETALLARDLTNSGFLVATGGGPGLMEAGNLGAYFAKQDVSVLRAAVSELAKAPNYDHGDWLKMGWLVRRDFPSSTTESLGVPTWFYGHEPPNLFATQIAKYFENSLREEGLLAIATHGVIFAEGNGGTVQEIFQDACQNYYDNYGYKSPMVLFGSDYWNPIPNEKGEYAGKTKPAWPLLRKLAAEKKFEHLIMVTSNTNEALKLITGFEPSPPSSFKAKRAHAPRFA